ncbi:hypothetical protein ACHMW6_12325 [Pseudoduganella sp. UC29_106]|uniref:hypothetical protein n=1 Tax=Pseudoduganella sp. UC29_106 TaxID=3374553 RepID=UPI0037572C50
MHNQMPAQADQIDELAGLGRWSMERHTSHMSLSPVAWRLLGLQNGTGSDVWTTVVTDDAEPLQAVLSAISRDGAALVHDFRTVDPGHGIRWLRLQALAAGDLPVATGILTDITAAKRAATRERFNFALTQYLIGTDTFDDAVDKILHLVCDELGWEWGAFWARKITAQLKSCVAGTSGINRMATMRNSAALQQGWW